MKMVFVAHEKNNPEKEFVKEVDASEKEIEKLKKQFNDFYRKKNRGKEFWFHYYFVKEK